MKILFDFDGTITNVAHEYEWLQNHFIRLASDALQISPGQCRALLDDALLDVSRSPHACGWTSNGMLSAFCDEDPFMLFTAAIERAGSWLAGDCPAPHPIRCRRADLMQIAQSAYADLHDEPLSVFNAPEPQAVKTIHTLLMRDCEIVVASNSPAPRIIRKFEHVGLRPVDNDDNPSAQFRIRGNAQKFVLQNPPDTIRCNGRDIHLNRPNYAKIIRDERPQVIVGDVYSLDLALPIECAKREPRIYEDFQAYLRMRPYTPSWAVDAMLTPEPNIPKRLLNHFEDLPALILKHR